MGYPLVFEETYAAVSPFVSVLAEAIGDDGAFPRC